MKKLIITTAIISVIGFVIYLNKDSKKKSTLNQGGLTDGIFGLYLVRYNLIDNGNGSLRILNTSDSYDDVLLEMDDQVEGYMGVSGMYYSILKKTYFIPKEYLTYINDGKI